MCRRSHFSQMIAAAILVLLGSLPGWGESLSIAPLQVLPFQLEDAAVELDSTEFVNGWDYGVCIDLSHGEIVASASGAATLTINNGGAPDFESLGGTQTQITHSVVSCFNGCSPLPPSEDQELALLTVFSFVQPGEVGELCFCDPPQTPMSILLADGSSISPLVTCGAFSPDCSNPIIPNRSISEFEIIPRAGEPGEFDLELSWFLECSTPATNLSTRVVFEVDGVTVFNTTEIVTATSTTCCSSPSCGPSTCGIWSVGGVPLTGFCAESTRQQHCTCQLRMITEAFGISIAPGQNVTARLIATSFSRPETITDDDTWTRLAPFFNRELSRIALVPSPTDPSSMELFAYYSFSADPVDAPVDYSMEIFAVVGGNPTPFAPIIPVLTPTGVKNCQAANCMEDCVPVGGSTTIACAEGDTCDECDRANQPEPLGLTLNPSPGTPIEVFLSAAPGALPEAQELDDVITIPFDGPIPAANRWIVNATAVPIGPDTAEITVTWRAETSSTELENLSAILSVKNGVQEIAVSPTAVVRGFVPTSSPSSNCNPTPCGNWEVNGNPATGNYSESPRQSTCVCGVQLTQVLPFVSAQLGDTLTIALTPTIDGIGEALTEDDSLTIVVGASQFVRGDANDDGGVDVADAISLLTYLFLSGPLPCRDAGDVDDSGALDVADPISILGYLLQGGTLPPAPFPNCGSDPTADLLDCNSSSSCP